MANVFLSYDHEDMALATQLAAALEKAGHIVWYDRHIHGGAQYSRKIEQALDAANAVIVLWTERSLDSAWVRDEAAEGRDRGKLVPLSVGGVTPPMGFRQFQTIDLGSWKGRGKVPQLAHVLEAVASQSEPEPDLPPRMSRPTSHGPPPPRPRPRWLLTAAAAIAVLLLAMGAWRFFGGSSLPVVEVAAADASPRSQAAANDLFVKLGSLAQIGNGKWQLSDASVRSDDPDLLFRIADFGSEAAPHSSLVLLGENRTVLWSREFSVPPGRQADLRQLLGLTAGRVLGCALESGDGGGLTVDLTKIFLDACASLADLSGNEYGLVTSKLRTVVGRRPGFKPAWSRLLAADATAIEYARFTSAEESLRRQFLTDAAQVRKHFPDLPELAIAELRVHNEVGFAEKIATLEAANERSPDNVGLLAELSFAYLNVGRMDDAISAARRAAELDPLSPGGSTTYIMTLAHGGQLDTARSELAKIEKLWAGTGALRDTQLAFAVRYGDPALAMKLDPQGYNTKVYYDARATPSAANIAKLKAGIDEFRAKRVNPAQVGWAIQALGEFGLVDDVYYWLGRLSNKQLADISYLLFRPAMKSIRRDPRFMQMAKRIGLVEYWRKSGEWPDFCREPGIPYDCQAEAAKYAQ